MTAVLLTRIDPERNMERFYKLDIQPTLFGEFSLVREWGRIGHGGQVRVTAYGTTSEAEAARDQLSRKKVRRGYAGSHDR